MKKFLIIAAGAAAVSATPALAATSTTTMPVTASVIDTCQVSASPMAFGQLPVLGSANVDTSTTITLNCTVNANYDVSMDLGLNSAASSQRYLVSTTDATQKIPYNVYSDSTRTVAWTNGAGNTVAATSLTGTSTHTAYGRIPMSATAVKAGTYQDTVTVTVTF